MLFRKKVEPSCLWCEKGTKIDDETCVCLRNGVVDMWGRCSAFRYDPLKRQPERHTPVFSSYIDEKDFEI